MAIGYLRRPLRISAAGGWLAAWELYTRSAGETKRPKVVDGWSVVCTLTQAGVAAPTPIDVSSYFSLSGNIATVSVPRTITPGWARADYDFHLRIFDPVGVTDDLVILSDPASSRVKVVP